MRIVISSPPKMGNKWIKCLLSRVYDLQWIIGEDSPDTNIDRFSQFVVREDSPTTRSSISTAATSPSSATSSTRSPRIS